MQKLKLITITALSVFTLAGCSLSNNNKISAYQDTKIVKPKPQTLTQFAVVKTFTVNYAAGSDSDSNQTPRNRLDTLVNNYLQSIKNLKEYHVDIKTSSTSDAHNNSNDIEVYTVILTKQSR